MSEFLEDQEGSQLGESLEESPIDLTGFETTSNSEGEDLSEPVRSVTKSAPRKEVSEEDRIKARERLLGSKVSPEKAEANAQAEKSLNVSEVGRELESDDLSDDMLQDPETPANVLPDISKYVESHPPATQAPKKPVALKRAQAPDSASQATPTQEEQELSEEIEDLLKYLEEGATTQQAIQPLSQESVRAVEVEKPAIEPEPDIGLEGGDDMFGIPFAAALCKAPAQKDCFSDFYVVGNFLPDPHVGLKRTISWDSDVPTRVREAIQSLRGAGVLLAAPKFLPTERKNSTLCYPAPSEEGQEKFSYFLASAAPVYIPASVSPLPGVAAYAERFLLVAACPNPNEKTLTILYNFQGIEKDSLTVLGAEQ